MHRPINKSVFHKTPNFILGLGKKLEKGITLYNRKDFRQVTMTAGNCKASPLDSFTFCVLFSHPFLNSLQLNVPSIQNYFLLTSESCFH